MTITALLTVAAFLLIAWDVSRKEKRPLVVLAGLTFFFSSLVLHLFSGRGFMETTASITAEVGIGLLLAAGLVALRKTSAKPFFAIGLLALGVSGLLNGTARLVGLHPYEGEAKTLLVELGPDDEIDELTGTLDFYQAHYERAFPNLTLGMDEDLAQVYLIHVAADQVKALTADLKRDIENVDHIELNRTVALDLPKVEATFERAPSSQVMVNDPMVGSQWGMDAIHGHEAHALLADLSPQKKAVVAIVDTGVDQKHEDVKGVFRKSPGTTDAHGHGSHCAGIAGAVTNNGIGIASLNWNGQYVEIAGYHALNQSGFGTVESIAQAIIDATRDKSDVISLSLGDYAPIPPKAIVDAILFAQRNDVIVLASAGNSNQDAAYHMPSNIEGVIVVSAIDEQSRKASFSNTNTSLKRPIAAPGVNILSLKPKNGYVSMSGTSMSTPMVAGLVGVMRALNPSVTAAEVYTILHDTGTTVKDSQHIGRVINAEKAIQALLGSS